jgi:hypothetical protein
MGSVSQTGRLNWNQHRFLNQLFCNKDWGTWCIGSNCWRYLGAAHGGEEQAMAVPLEVSLFLSPILGRRHLLPLHHCSPSEECDHILHHSCCQEYSGIEPSRFVHDVKKRIGGSKQAPGSRNVWQYIFGIGIWRLAVAGLMTDELHRFPVPVFCSCLTGYRVRGVPFYTPRMLRLY